MASTATLSDPVSAEYSSGAALVGRFVTSRPAPPGGGAQATIDPTAPSIALDPTASQRLTSERLVREATPCVE
jgi:hypothetical protein